MAHPKPLTAFADAVILNVDDSDGARYAKSRILVRAGFQVIEAASGGEALAKARALQPNLILLDVKLPDINGIEVCRQLKQDAQTQTILVLQTSASFIGTADKIRALDIGADNYLVEPIEPDELIANVKALLRLGMVERELREVDRRKNEFLATLAHELRNPLGPIRTAVELLRRLDGKDAEAQENLRNIIGRHTDHLARLVDDLLDVSRISQGKISLQSEPVELKAFINTALESSHTALDARSHALRVQMPEQDIRVRGDHVRLCQIVTNLLLNAAKFTRPGGQIQLDVEADDKNVIIRVTDNGIGIPADNLGSIFELFTQSGHVENSVQDGLGIGLSLVRTLVDLHGGSVRAYSEGLGQGSTFEVTLPLDTPQGERLQVAAAAVTSKGPKRVLVVDDNVDAADTLAQLLTLLGHQVQARYSGGGALEIARQFLPNVIFLDIGLPDINGFEVARRLRALPNLPGFYLVALTGYGQAHDREAALAAGFDEHFAKPLELARLAELGLDDSTNV